MRRKAKPTPGWEFGSDSCSHSPLSPRLLPISCHSSQPSQNSDVAKGPSPPPACPLSSQGYQCIDWQGGGIRMGGRCCHPGRLTRSPSPTHQPSPHGSSVWVPLAVSPGTSLGKEAGPLKTRAPFFSSSPPSLQSLFQFPVP